jgi:hypothetical protein
MVMLIKIKIVVIQVVCEEVKTVWAQNSKVFYLMQYDAVSFGN